MACEVFPSLASGEHALETQTEGGVLSHSQVVPDLQSPIRPCPGMILGERDYKGTQGNFGGVWCAYAQIYQIVYF